MTAQSDNQPQTFDNVIDNAWKNANIWGRIGMVIGTLLVVTISFSCLWSYTAARNAREAAIENARAELQQNIGEEVEVFGNPHPAKFRVEELDRWEGPVKGTLVVLLPERAQDIQILPSLEVSDTDSSLFGLTNFELALSQCSFSVNYNVDGVQRARIWNGCPTLAEGIKINIREIEARVGEEPAP